MTVRRWTLSLLAAIVAVAAGLGVGSAGWGSTATTAYDLALRHALGARVAVDRPTADQCTIIDGDGRAASQPGRPLSFFVAAETLPRAAETADGAANAANGVRLGQQLARESANSAFKSSGELSSGAIDDSNLIIPGSRIGNPDVIKSLTSDGSNISDWGKYTTRSYQSPSGDFQVHYYRNRTTGAVNYGSDYKVVRNGSPPR